MITGDITLYTISGKMPITFTTSKSMVETPKKYSFCMDQKSLVLFFFKRRVNQIKYTNKKSQTNIQQ